MKYWKICNTRVVEKILPSTVRNCRADVQSIQFLLPYTVKWNSSNIMKKTSSRRSQGVYFIVLIGFLKILYRKVPWPLSWILNVFTVVSHRKYTWWKSCSSTCAAAVEPYWRADVKGWGGLQEENGSKVLIATKITDGGLMTSTSFKFVSLRTNQKRKSIFLIG